MVAWNSGTTLGRKMRAQVASEVAVDHHMELVSSRQLVGHMVLEFEDPKSEGNHLAQRWEESLGESPGDLPPL